MMTSSQDEIGTGDPLGYGAELGEALRQPALAEFEQGLPAVSLAARAAALRLAIALGYCRLGDVQPEGDLDGTLPAPLAAAAAEELAGRLAGAVEDAECLAERCDAAETRLERESLCCELLELRMDAWAALQSLCEAYSSSLADEDPEALRLEAALDALTDQLDAVDPALQDQQETLSAVAGTQLLDNWRRALGGLYRAAPPWWLDGRLEETARYVREEALAALPSPAVWRTLRERGAAGEGPAGAGVTPRPGRELPAPVTELVLAATTGDRPPQNRPFRWFNPAPGSAETAQLLVPLHPPATAATELRLSLLDAGQPAEKWVGQPIDLSGIGRTVDARAGISFTYQELYQAWRSAGGLILRVGPAAAQWQPEAE